MFCIFLRNFLYLKNKQAAEDCVQNVFVDYWNRAMKSDIKNKKAYLYQSVRNQCAKVLAKQKRFNHEFDWNILEAEPLSDPYEGASYEHRLLKAVFHQIDRLPPRCQRIFKLTMTVNPDGTFAHPSVALYNSEGRGTVTRDKRFSDNFGGSG